MSEAEPRRMVWPRFSLLNLLTLTALIAIGTAIGLAFRKNRLMVQQRDELLSLSSRLQVDDAGALALSDMPSVASDFHSWHVHVPSGQDYELRLGVGAVSEKGIPPVTSSVPIPAGRHRVTLHAADSPDEQFRYVVYVDGKPAIDKTMGSDWIPGGWSSASGISWPRETERSPAPLQLGSRSYESKVDVGKGSGHYFNGQSDEYVTRTGYRLWIDLADRTYPPASPFMGFTHDPGYHGIGLRDGLRYRSSGGLPYQWKFTRPSLNTIDPVLLISAEFFARDGTTVSGQTPSFKSWQLRDDASGETALNWQADPAQSAYSAFLQARLQSGDVLQPTVELKWDAGRPDEVGLRIADTPANDRIRRWRLHLLGGAEHLWRELQIGDRTISAAAAIANDAAGPPDAMVALDLGNSAAADTRLQWRTDETLPLQILERTQPGYAAMGLYKGLPLTFGIQIPAALKPTLAVRVLDEAPSAPGSPFPGGAIFDELQIDLEAVQHDWIWLQAKPNKLDSSE